MGVVKINTTATRHLITEAKSAVTEANLAWAGASSSTAVAHMTISAAGWGSDLVEACNVFNNCWVNDVSLVTNAASSWAEFALGYCDTIDAIEGQS